MKVGGYLDAGGPTCGSGAPNILGFQQFLESFSTRPVLVGAQTCGPAKVAKCFAQPFLPHWGKQVVLSEP